METVRPSTSEELTITGKMMARKVDFRIQRTARQMIWTRVKRWTRLRGTWRRKEKSGWCLGGIRYSLIRSQNWNRQQVVRLIVAQHIYRKERLRLSRCQLPGVDGFRYGTLKGSVQVALKEGNWASSLVLEGVPAAI